MSSHGCEHDNISSCDVLSNQEHPHGHVLVHVVSQVLGLKTLGQLYELLDLMACLVEQDFIKIACLGNLLHDGIGVGDPDILLDDGVVWTCLTLSLDKQWNLQCENVSKVVYREREPICKSETSANHKLDLDLHGSV